VARIVVGVDGSPGGREALRFALGEARLRGCALHVVHAWRLPLVESVPDAFLLEGSLERGPELEDVARSLERAARQTLDSSIRDVLGNAEPAVEIEREVVEGPAAQVLLERAQGADLLVVGARGRGGFAGLVLGSVSTQCSQHASCPVVIVPAESG
jgi:nucleotide-binding universal stress UspA family protein